MKYRNTTTFPKEVYIIGSQLDSRDRLMFYDTIFKHFFKGEEIVLEDMSDMLRLAIVCVTPQIRCIQTKFENGTAQKKFKKETQGFLCPNEKSEMKRNEANESEKSAESIKDIYDNKYPFPKLIYILNNKYINSTNSSARTHASNSNKNNDDAQAEAVLTQIQSHDQDLYKYFYDILTTLDSVKTKKVRGVPVSSQDLIQAIRKLFFNPEFITMLESTQKESQKSSVGDPIGYSISVLYNLSKSIYKPKRVPAQDFEERRYSKEQLNGLYDTLDDVKLDE